MSNPGETVCRICRAPSTFAFSAREMYFGTREKFDYVRCSDCGSLQIAEVPANPSIYYDANDADYYTRVARPVARHVQEEPSPIRARWTAFRLAAGGLLRPFSGQRYGHFTWFTRTGTNVEDAILEVGCGSGRLLWRLHHEGFRNLTGIDLHLGPAVRNDASPWFSQGSLESHQGVYSLVMAHHSFEHVEDPRLAFRAFARLVESGGWLLLRIPLADSWACRHYQADWVQLDAPRHLHLHTRRSIEGLAKDFGFRVERVVDDSGPFQIWGSELYRRDVPLRSAAAHPRTLADRAARLRARLRALILRATGQGDQACFYLRRLGSE